MDLVLFQKKKNIHKNRKATLWLPCFPEALPLSTFTFYFMYSEY